MTGDYPRQTVVLAWHVDYWDYLGWKDPFASKAYTARQKAYRSRLKKRQLVTPEIVIGNANAAKGWEQGVTAAAAKPARVQIDYDPKMTAGGVNVDVVLRDPRKVLPPKAVVRVVLFQRKAVTKVPAGENKGRTLTEYFVVRGLSDDLPVKPALSKGVRATFELPSGVERENLGLAVLVEDAAAMETIECVSFDLPKARKPGSGRRLIVRELTAERGATVLQVLHAPAVKLGLKPVMTTAAFRTGNDRPVVLGFSAAAPHALDLAVRAPGEIGGLIIVAGRVEIASAAAKKLGKGFPVKLVYGREDAVVPLAVGEAALKVLTDAGVAATLEVVPTADHFGVLKEGAKTFLPWAADLE